MSQVKKESNLLDFTGVFLSIICAIHCTVGPLLILLLPALGGIFDSELFHIVVFFAIIPIAGLTFFRCYKKHKSKATLILAVVAIGLLFTGLIYEHGHAFVELFGSEGHHHHGCCHHKHGFFDHGFTLAGSFSIILHIL